MPTHSIYESVYQEIDTIGDGNYGIVFKARNKLENKMYAIKKFRLTDINKLKIIEETKILPKLSNKFIVKYYPLFVEQNNEYDKQIPYSGQTILYLPMELYTMNLRKLKDILDEEIKQFYNLYNFSKRALIADYIYTEYFADILKAVHYLHSQTPPILYKNFTLENILIGYSDHDYGIKISDVGLTIGNKGKYSKDINDDNLDSDCMAPEVRSGKYSKHSDMYSLGVILGQLFDINRDELKNLNLNSWDDYEYKPIKQMFLMRKLLNKWPSKRPDCEHLLRHKYEWAVSFANIAFTQPFSEAMHEKFESNFKSLSNPVSNEYLFSAILLKRCNSFKNQVFERLHSESPPTRHEIREFRQLNNIYNLNIVHIETNIIDTDIVETIMKILVKALHICLDLSQICDFAEKLLNEECESLWHSFASIDANFNLDNCSINWYNFPCVYVSFFDNTLISKLHISLINTSMKKFTSFREYEFVYASEHIPSDTLNEYKRIFLNAINSGESVEDIRLEIEADLRSFDQKQHYFCIVTTNQIYSILSAIKLVNIYVAYRYESYGIIISNMVNIMVEKNVHSMAVDINRSTMNESEKRALMYLMDEMSDFSILGLWAYERGVETAFIKFSCDCSVSQFNYPNYSINGFNAQIIWTDNISLNSELEITCGSRTVGMNLRKFLIPNDRIEIENTMTDIFQALLKCNHKLNFETSESVRRALIAYRNIYSHPNVAIVYDLVMMWNLFELRTILADSRSRPLRIAYLQALFYYVNIVLQLNNHRYVCREIFSQTFMRHIDSGDDTIAYLILAFVDKTITHCNECLTRFLDMNCVKTILSLVKPHNPLPLIQLICSILVWILKRGPDSDILASLLPAFETLVWHNDKVIHLFVHAFMKSAVTLGLGAKLLISTGLMERLLKRIVEPNSEIQRLFLDGYVGIIETNQELRRGLNGGALNVRICLELSALMLSREFPLNVYALNILYSICFSSSAQLKPLFKSKLIDTLVMLVVADDRRDIQEYIFERLNYIVSVCDDQQMAYLYDINVLDALNRFAQFCVDSDLFLIYVLDCLSFICKLIANCDSKRNSIYNDIIRNSILDVIYEHINNRFRFA